MTRPLSDGSSQKRQWEPQISQMGADGMKSGIRMRSPGMGVPIHQIVFTSDFICAICVICGRFELQHIVSGGTGPTRLLYSRRFRVIRGRPIASSANLGIAA